MDLAPEKLLQRMKALPRGLAIVAVILTQHMACATPAMDEKPPLAR
jgi:hypothetical protein